ncbi:ESPR domain-containing protein, partial [Mitsuokella jalaludinii]
MNRIFKVIWSKTKHCYIVVSEYAKANTKAVHTGLRTTAAAAAVAAMLLAPVNYNYAWAADPTVTVEVVDSSTTTQTATVYTTDGAYSKTETDNKLADKANAADVYSKTETDNKLADKANAADVYSKTETDNKLADKANATDVYSKTETDAQLADKANAADVYSKTETDAQLADKANAADVYSKTEADNADKQLQTNIDTEKTAREAGDKALDDRITAVKDYVLNETGNNYVSKADAAVQDAGVVKADKKIGENVTALGKGLYDETAARIGADAAQDKVIQQVNENAAAGIKTLTEAYNNEVAARQSADTNLQTNIDNEAAARKAADGKLVDAVNSGLSLSNDNVLQKNTTAIDDQGNVTTSKTAANEMILNKGKDNQITLSENGIKVGLNSGVMDKDGFYA